MAKAKIDLDIARTYAETVVKALAPHCERIEIAGSIRRCKPEVGDIEIVAYPWHITNLFGVSTGVTQLDMFNYELFGRVVKNGSKYKQIEMRVGINLDLFIVTPPAQWGVIFLIRTGPAEFSKKMVTHRLNGGELPFAYTVQEGAVWVDDVRIDTPEEQDFFDLCGMDFVPPEKRGL